MNVASSQRVAAAGFSGCVDDVTYDGVRLSMHGWMLDPDQEFDEYHVRLDDLPAVPAERWGREDLAASFPEHAHARRAAFPVSVPT